MNDHLPLQPFSVFGAGWSERWHRGCQFVIATHSPFLLGMNGAKIYDLDTEGVPVRKWTELENVREYFDFFQARKGEFE